MPCKYQFKEMELSPILAVRFVRSLMFLKIIRIYHECEGRIEKSVQKIAVWHHEACPVMTNSDPEGRIFLYPTLTRIMDSFSCSPLFFFISYPHAFFKKRRGYCNHLRLSVCPSIRPSVRPSVRYAILLNR